MVFFKKTRFKGDSMGQILNLKYINYEEFTNLHNIFFFQKKRKLINDLKAKKSYNVKKKQLKQKHIISAHISHMGPIWALLACWVGTQLPEKKMFWVQEIFSLEFMYMWKPCYVYFWLFKGRKHLVV